MRPTFDTCLWILMFFILVQCLQISNLQIITTELNEKVHQLAHTFLLDINKKQGHSESYLSQNVALNKQDSRTDNKMRNFCNNCFNMENKKERSSQRLVLKHQHLQTQIPPPSTSLVPLSLVQLMAFTNSSSSIPSKTSKYFNSSATPRRWQQIFLQSYLIQQGPAGENTAQEASEEHHGQSYRKVKRETTKSFELSFERSRLLSNEELAIKTVRNKLISSSDIRKSDTRFNNTKTHSSFPSLSSTLTSKPGEDFSLFQSLPAISNGHLLSADHFLSKDSLSSSFEDVSNENHKSKSSDDKNVMSESELLQPPDEKASRALKRRESVVIIDDVENFVSGAEISISGAAVTANENLATGAVNNDKIIYGSDHKPIVLPLRPIVQGPHDDEHDKEMSVVYADQHTEVRLVCEVDLDITMSSWYKNGLSVHAIERSSRVTDYRFIKEINGALTITNVMLEDDGKWQCEAENSNSYIESARPIKLIVLDRPKAPYLLIDSRRLDAGNIFVPVKENSELNLACVSEGGNPKPTLTWEVLLNPGVDRHAQKVTAEVLELEEIRKDKDKLPYKINSGVKSEVRLPVVYRAHHNARILCVMEHPTLKMRLNASLLLDVQYTPSFAISRTPGFGYPLREGYEVSLKCDVDSNPISTPRWQKDDTETPVPQTNDGFLNFSSIRREHSGWYKCTSRHLNFQYSSIGYYLSVRFDSVDVTSEPDDQEISIAASHNPNKGQLEVQLGGAVTLQCPQGSLGCWSHLDPVTARLRGLGHGLSTPTGMFSLKDIIYQDAGTYKCIGQSVTSRKKVEVLQTIGLTVKGMPTVIARNATPVAYPGSPLHLSVEFCANPPAHAARWLHGDRVFTPGNQYGSTVLAYGVTDLPTPFCKEARLTYVSMHERVPRLFYFIVSSSAGVAEAVFKVNFTIRYRTMSNSVDDEEEELSEPEEIHFPVFGSGATSILRDDQQSLFFIYQFFIWLTIILHTIKIKVNV